MNPSTRRTLGLFGVTAAAAALLPTGANAQAAAPVMKNKIVLQVSDAEPAKWNLALNNLRNLQIDLGEENVEVELVAYGPGIGMLKGDSAVAKRVADTLKTGAKVVACENTMRGQKLVYADMLPDIGFVPSGVVELMRKQQQGFAYLRP